MSWKKIVCFIFGHQWSYCSTMYGTKGESYNEFQCDRCKKKETNFIEI